VSAQTYITPTMLAILAHLTFQLLYDPVANGLVDVANFSLDASGLTLLTCFPGPEHR